MNFFDCDFGVGKSAFPLHGTPSPSDALAVMDRYEIADAMVYDRALHESGSFDKFDFILDYCSKSPRLHPSIDIVPPATGEQPPPARLVDFCLANGIKAARVCPTAHNFIADSRSMGPLLAELDRHHMPLLWVSTNINDHPWAHVPAWRDIRDIATAFPRLPLLVIYTGMLQGRNLFPILDQCPNVMADLTCASFHFVETVVERYGNSRLFLASHFPIEEPGLYTTWVNYAGVGDEDRRNIAGDNMRRLLEAVK